MNQLLNISNHIGMAFGYPNQYEEYPAAVKDLFEENSFKGSDLEFYPLNHESGLSMQGLDFSKFVAGQQTYVSKLPSPIMSSKNDWGYKGISLDIRGREESTKSIQLLAKDAFLNWGSIRSFSDLKRAPKTHSGGIFPLNNLEVICHIFEKCAFIAIRNIEEDICLQQSITISTVDPNGPILEDDVTPLFQKDGKLSKGLLEKLFKGTHPDLQLGEDPGFKLFKEDSDLVVI